MLRNERKPNPIHSAKTSLIFESKGNSEKRISMGHSKNRISVGLNAKAKQLKGALESTPKKETNEYVINAYRRHFRKSNPNSRSVVKLGSTWIHGDDENK
jgi:hypothetical protein